MMTRFRTRRTFGARSIRTAVELDGETMHLTLKQATIWTAALFRRFFCGASRFDPLFRGPYEMKKRNQSGGKTPQSKSSLV
jgi:hypothetical protein